MDNGRRSKVDAVATERDAPVNDRREIFGWTMYDWANSTFSTTVVTALLGPYLTALAQAVVGRSCSHPPDLLYARVTHRCTSNARHELILHLSR